MKGSIQDERPLDHATARIVSELAAALLPRLRETVATEILRATDPLRINERVEETLAALERIKNAADEAAILQDATKRSSEQTISGALNQVEHLSVLLETFAEYLRNEDERATETTQLMEVLQKAIPAWEGILKADGRAHTRELSELSSEISEVLKDTRTSLLSVVNEAVEKESEKRDARLKELLREHGGIVERRMARFEKIVVFAVACAAAVSIGAILFR
jgi:ElaB/YqjD/DUF883 family membrane-anchored ribosome-binding protein